LTHPTNSLMTTLNKTLKKFYAEGKNRFYLSEFITEAKVSIREAEDFFLPLLKKGKLEGKLEVRCPCCGKDVEAYDRMSQVPEEIECEICGCRFSKSKEYIEIILEVGDKFFRDQKCSSYFDRKDSYTRRATSVTE
jgi:hypothetical protein